jgi:DNA-binding GntR family transcriptional regulator
MHDTEPGPRSSPIASSSLAEQVMQHLRQQIYEGALAPGLRLDENELAAALGVSRTPVREALRQLAAQGLVEIRSRRGCFVTELTLQDQKDIFPIMARLEGWVAHEVADHATKEDLDRLGEMHAALERHAAAGNVDRYWAANHVFHTALQDLAGNRWLQELLGQLRRKLGLFRQRSLKLPGRVDRSLAEHRALMKALRGHDGARAEAVMRDHLMNQLDALLRLEHDAGTQTRRPRRRSSPHS